VTLAIGSRAKSNPYNCRPTAVKPDLRRPSPSRKTHSEVQSPRTCTSPKFSPLSAGRLSAICYGESVVMRVGIKIGNSVPVDALPATYTLHPRPISCRPLPETLSRVETAVSYRKQKTGYRPTRHSFRSPKFCLWRANLKLDFANPKEPIPASIPVPHPRHRFNLAFALGDLFLYSVNAAFIPRRFDGRD
jgi:hypothetical protein